MRMPSSFVAVYDRGNPIDHQLNRITRSGVLRDGGSSPNPLLAFVDDSQEKGWKSVGGIAVQREGVESSSRGINLGGMRLVPRNNHRLPKREALRKRKPDVSRRNARQRPR